jgi:hypothetical protein
LSRTTNEQGRCRVRSGTDNPCPRPAVAKVGGIAFCEPCAREQEAYFAIGEFTEAEEGLGGERLARAIDLMKKIRLRHQMVGDPEPDRGATSVTGGFLGPTR